MSTVIVMQPVVSQGTVTSSAAPWEAGKLSAQAKGLMNDADIQNASKSVNVCLEESYDGGDNWQSGPAAQWAGNTPDPFHPGMFVAPNVSVGYANAGVTPTHIRVRMDVATSTSIGASVTFS